MSSADNDDDEASPDPMQAPYWTLAMAAAWILWRKPQQVAEHWHVNFELHGFPHRQSMNDVLGIAEYQEKDQASGNPSFNWPPLKLGSEKAANVIGKALVSQLSTDGFIKGCNQRVTLSLRDNESILVGPNADRYNVDKKDDWHDAIFLKGSREPFLIGVRVNRINILKLWPETNADKINIDTLEQSIDHSNDVEFPIIDEFSTDDKSVLKAKDPDDDLQEKISNDLNHAFHNRDRRQPKRLPLMARLLFAAAKGEDVAGQLPTSPSEVARVKTFGSTRTLFTRAIQDLEENGLLDKYSPEALRGRKKHKEKDQNS